MLIIDKPTHRKMEYRLFTITIVRYNYRDYNTVSTYLNQMLPVFIYVDCNQQSTSSLSLLKSIIIYLQCKPISKHYSVQHGTRHSTYLQFKPISKHYIARQGIELRANTGNRNIHNIWRKNQDLATKGKNSKDFSTTPVFKQHRNRKGNN
jgi:hypothetical protein